MSVKSALSLYQLLLYLQSQMLEAIAVSQCLILFFHQGPASKWRQYVFPSRHPVPIFDIDVISRLFGQIPGPLHLQLLFDSQGFNRCQLGLTDSIRLNQSNHVIVLLDQCRSLLNQIATASFDILSVFLKIVAFVDVAVMTRALGIELELVEDRLL